MDYKAVRNVIYDKYPWPCKAECGQEKPCRWKRKCPKWIGVDFCRWRDLKNFRRQRISDSVDLHHNLKGYEGWLKRKNLW